jgi:hypothetical protein
MGTEPRAGEALAGCLLARVPENYRRALELTDFGGLTRNAPPPSFGSPPRV